MTVAGVLDWRLRLYRGAWVAASPLLSAWLKTRARESSSTIHNQRFALYPPLSTAKDVQERPVIWFHAVSVGECAAAFPLLQRCLAEWPNAHALLTHGTVSAGLWLQRRVPPNTTLQYAPFDDPNAVARFLDRWNPQAGIFLESELWPNLILAAHSRGVPLALVNANISPKSTARWSTSLLMPIVCALLAKFDLICPQSESSAQRLRALGADDTAPPANLKYAAATSSAVRPQPPGKQQRWWVAGSTHVGEEEAVLSAHQRLASQWIDLVTVIVPRHPERAASICELAEARGIRCAQTEGADPVAHILKNSSSMPKVWIVGTIGHLPAMYAQCAIAFVGGSLFPSGRGHNVAEAAVAECAVICGFHTGPFKEMVYEMCGTHYAAVWQVANANELANCVENLFQNPKHLKLRQQKAKAAVSGENAVAIVWRTVNKGVIQPSLLRQR
mmetsp:Transcript_1179/g.2461  ORF Transcript_1179/g.2461 Transcript_1179/m.2461 type:complete len:445 (-) Transcript_1179:168-1502(-)